MLKSYKNLHELCDFQTLSMEITDLSLKSYLRYRELFDYLTLLVDFETDFGLKKQFSASSDMSSD